MKIIFQTFILLAICSSASALPENCSTLLSVRHDQGQSLIEGTYKGQPVFLKYYRDGGRKNVTGNIGDQPISYSQWNDGGRFNSSGNITRDALDVLNEKGFSIGENRGLTTRHDGGRLIVEGIYNGREVFIVRYKDGGRTHYYGWVDSPNDEFSYSEWYDGGRLNSRGTPWTEWTSPMRHLGYTIDGN